MKKQLLITCLVLYALAGNAQTSVNIYHAKDSTAGCFSWPTTPVYETFNFYAEVTGYAPTDSFFIKILFGDGGFASFYQGQFTPWPFNINSTGAGGIDHIYFNAGSYDVTYIVVAPDGKADTVTKYDDVIITSSCSQFAMRTFIDLNGNCVFDPSTEVLAANVSFEMLNGNATYNYYAPTWSTLDIPTGYNYTAKIDVNAIAQLGYSLSCGSSGFYNFTTTPGSSDTAWFPLQCNSNFDLSVVAAHSYFRYGNTSYMWLDINNVACSSTTGTYSITLDPNLTFLASLTPPNSNTGQSYFYNFSNLFTLGNGQGSLNNLIAVNIDPSVQVGDSLCYQVSVIPTANDVNPLNNFMPKCDYVYNSWDPNAKSVSPKGDGVDGNIAPGTRLTYTIMFQNTGNDTAYKVVLRDTLDPDLDINSIRIRGASHPFNFYIFNGNVLEFEFKNIMLPDSGANQLLSNGMVMFEIDHKDGLPIGTKLKNKAAIFFDSNPAVITNEVVNTLAQPTGISSPELMQTIVSPNPVNDELHISSANFKNLKWLVLDNTGRIIMNGETKNEISVLDVRHLATGVYFLKLSKSDDTVIKKFVKL